MLMNRSSRRSNKLSQVTAGPLILLVAFTLNASAQTSDTTPPVLHGLSFNPTTVNNLDQPANVTVGFDVTDDISGISTILIWFMSPSGQQLVFANPTSPPWSGGALSVVSSGVATFPQFSETGVWTVWHVELYDVAGNSSFIGPGQLAAMGLPTQIIVTGAAPSLCDIKQDGNVSISDVQLMINEAMGLAPAVNDINGTEWQRLPMCKS